MTVYGYQPVEAWPGLESQLGLQPDLILIALGVPRQELWSETIGSGVAGLWMESEAALTSGLG